MKNGRVITCAEIINLCGGTLEVAYALRLSQAAIYNWEHSGIPERRWAWFTERTGLTANQLHAANQRARLSSAKRA